ncbi:MAG TPA: hypothetical protein VFU32_04910 [Ktedonobacterales bacterium]|nr:hypothetical protein [Ktedonobacterales bacterium]
MEQDLTGVNDTTNMPGKAADIPGNLPNDIDEPGSAERAADLVREETTGPVPLGPATPDQGEDAVLFVETIDERELGEGMLPPEEAEGIVLPEEVLIAAELAGASPAGTDLSSAVLGIDLGPNLEEGAPWYQSRWMYLGIGLVAAAAATLGIGGYVLIRNRSRRKQGLHVTRRVTSALGRTRFPTVPIAQGRLSQLTGQLSGQAGKFTGQVSKFSGQAQSQLSRLTRTPQSAVNLKPLQQQLTTLTGQAGEQLRSLGATTKATTASAVGKTQASLSQVGQSVAAGTSGAKHGLKRSGKMARNLTLGATAGMLWSYLYAPQDGETTRQHLKQMVPPQLKKKNE